MAKTSKSKKVNVQSMKKATAKYNEYKTIRVMDGEYEVIIPVHFSNTQISTFLCELTQWSQKLEELNITKDELSFVFMGLILKYFSDIEFPEKIENMLEFIRKLSDTGILYEVLNEYGEENLDFLNKSMNATMEFNIQVDDSNLPIELLGRSK